VKAVRWPVKARPVAPEGWRAQEPVHPEQVWLREHLAVEQAQREWVWLREHLAVEQAQQEWAWLRADLVLVHRLRPLALRSPWTNSLSRA